MKLSRTYKFKIQWNCSVQCGWNIKTPFRIINKKKCQAIKSSIRSPLYIASKDVKINSKKYQALVLLVEIKIYESKHLKILSNQFTVI